MLGAFSALALDGPLTPADSLKRFQTEPGLRVELVAAEPMVVDPVAIAWDERGRMFVVENRGYPTGPGKDQPPAGQVALLVDTNGDGSYDKRTVFADGLTFPNGVMPWKGGVYVTCAPNLYYFKDTNGDGMADVKQIVFTGFQDLSTTQLRVSHPMLALDNWVYLTSGLTAAKIVSPSNTNRPPVSLNRMDGRFRPGTDQIEPAAGTAQFGQTFDAFGRRFICSNRNHIQHVVLQLRHLQRNPHLSFSQVVADIPDHGEACRLYPLSANIVTAAWHGGYMTSACGLTIYNGTALPDEYRGNSFVCEPAANLVHRDVLGPDGVTFVAKRAYPTNEFLASPDNWFRPVNLAVGPDGALYVCDMYRKTIEHPEYLPEATRKVTDFESGKGMGRIYRVVADKSVARSQWSVAGKRGFDLRKASAKELCAELENPNVWWRMTAQRLLLEQQDKKAVSHLAKLAKQGQTPEGRVHALRTLDGLESSLNWRELLYAALEDREPAVREHAIALSESYLAQDADFASALAFRMKDDPNPRVRFQAALSLGVAAGNEVLSALVAIAFSDLDSPWTRAAVLSSIGGREDPFLQRILLEGSRKPAAAFPALMGELARIVAVASPKEKLLPALREFLVWKRTADLPWQMAAIGGFGDGLRARGLNEPGRSALMGLVSEDSGNLHEQVNGLFSRAGELMLDAKQPVTARLAAVSLLRQADYGVAGRALETSIEPQQPAEIQIAAIRALSQMAGAQTAALVERDRWNGFSPAVRDVVLSVLMANTNLVTSLLTAIEAGAVPAWTVNAERRTQLTKHRDEGIRKRAEALFKELTPGDRMRVYEESKPVLTLKGDGKNGHAVFEKNCVACHTFAGEGKLVGPDLTGIRNQPAEVILLHIIVPEYEMMPIYTAYNVETKDGEAYTGLLAAETPNNITLRMAQGIEQQIPRADIVTMATSRLSLMPQELEKAITKQELADLLAFLKGQ